MAQLIRNGSRALAATARIAVAPSLACALLGGAAEATIMMRIRFWGVRGSIAAAGPHTAEVGGNTSCVTIAGDEGAPLIVLDAGTGLRALGEHLMAQGRPLKV